MGGRWIGVRVSVIRYVSDHPQPGIVEAELRDAFGRSWRFIDKCSAFENLDLFSDTTYPQPGFILCSVIGRGRDASGRETVEVDLDVCSVDGEDRFTVYPTGLIEGKWGSSNQCPWKGDPDQSPADRAVGTDPGLEYR